MMKWLLHRLLRRFEREFDYDASYMHEVTDISAGAGLRYLALPLMSGMHGPAPEVWAGAALASVLDGDCGPCVQLTVDAAVKAGVDPHLLRACIQRDFDNAGAAGLGFRFTEAAIRDAPNTDALRYDIARDHGPEAVVAASYAAATSRAYPVLKRALGHGKECRQVRVAGDPVSVVREAS